MKYAETKRLIPDPVTAPNVHKIFELCAECDGNTEILYGSPDDDPNERTRILLTPNGQLISYEGKKYGDKISFKLDDYVFDSPDFTMEDTASIYEKIMNANEVSDR